MPSAPAKRVRSDTPRDDSFPPRLAWLGRILPLESDDLELIQQLVTGPRALDDISADAEALVLRPICTSGVASIEGGLLRLDPRIARHLRGDDRLDPVLSGCASLPVLSPRRTATHPEIEAGLVRLIACAEANGSAVRVRLWGPRGVGKEATALAVATAGNTPMLAVDLTRAPREVDAADLARRMLLEAWLRNALLYVTGLEAWRAVGRDADVTTLLAALGRDRGVTVLAGEKADTEPSLPDQIEIHLATPPAAGRLARWAHALASEGVSLDHGSLAVVAERFRLEPEQIDRAAADAAGRMRWAGARGLSPKSVEAVLAAARARSGHELAALATKVEARVAWEDLVLPAGVRAQLRELCDRVAFGERVLTDWGFRDHRHYGVSPTALFYGASGTGKTMAAAAVAEALSLDLYRVNLATVVSKYIGETEKNLDGIFAAAERSNAILLFDEADALFGKRSEVKEAHDRYANIEISYLLQRMEQYDGIAILSTNLRGHLDEAFTRRLAFVIHFPLPDERERLALWERAWPAGAPRGGDVDLAWLAKTQRLTGGNIANVALSAAFAAAAEKARISMRHVLHGLRREFAKMGKELDPRELDAAWRASKGGKSK